METWLLQIKDGEGNMVAGAKLECDDPEKALAIIDRLQLRNNATLGMIHIPTLFQDIVRQLDAPDAPNTTINILLRDFKETAPVPA